MIDHQPLNRGRLIRIDRVGLSAQRSPEMAVAADWFNEEAVEYAGVAQW